MAKITDVLKGVAGKLDEVGKDAEAGFIESKTTGDVTHLN